MATASRLIELSATEVLIRASATAGDADAADLLAVDLPAVGQIRRIKVLAHSGGTVQPRLLAIQDASVAATSRDELAELMSAAATSDDATVSIPYYAPGGRAWIHHRGTLSAGVVEYEIAITKGWRD